jgi:hypothetical protein
VVKKTVVSLADTVIAPTVDLLSQQSCTSLRHVPDPFFAAFHQAAKEMLPAEDFAVLEELAKGAANV